MKKTSLIISLIILMANGYAQEIETLMTKDRQSTTSYIGYGGPLLGTTQINKELGLTIGGRGGVVVNKKYAFGGIGFGMVNSPEFTGNNLSDNTNVQLQMSYGAGGVFIEYIFNIENLIHFSIPLNIMAGRINIYDKKAETEIESSAFFIIEPGINIDLNVSKHYTQSLYMSYRQALGSSLINLDDKNISGLNIGLIFKFGYH
jgi:hypothetical protein